MIYLFRAGQLVSRIIYLFWLPLNYYCYLRLQRARSRICWSESFDSKIESARANNWPWSKQKRSQPQPPIGSSSLWQRKQPDFRFGFCQKSAVLKSAALSCGCAVVVMFALPLFAGAHGTSLHLFIKGRAVDLTNYIFLPCGLGRPSELIS